MMTKKTWPEIKPILNRALDLPKKDRETFLVEICGNDPELLEEIFRYLEFDRGGDAFLEEPILDLIAGRPPEYRQGEQIGPYRLVGEIARGGMGVVYRAEREKGGFTQEVAIKVLKRGFDTGDFVRRFRTEQQILADLDHPFITRLLDGGATEDGLPYLVMELVAGSRLDSYYREQDLGPETAIELFLKICEAVDAAHRHMVVHCDLKPSNILVTAEGEPRLLDFGIAKVLSQSKDATQTFNLRLGTPPYVSPEQRRGKPITTVSDVFSLGGLLHLLLTGSAPSSIESSDQTPEPMSRAPELDVDRRRRLRGDLDAIVLRARQPDPGERYGSVAEMADDLRRHLRGVPVVARPYTFSYALGRFVARHRREVALTTALLFLLVFGIATGAQYLWQKNRADGLIQAYLAMLEVYDPVGSKPKATAIQAALNKLAADERFLHSEDRRLLYDRLGRQLYRLESYPEAVQLLRRALALRPAEDLSGCAASLNNLGLAMRELGDIQGAAEHFRTAQRLYRQSGKPDPALEYDILHNIAGSEMRQGRIDKAEPLYRQALAARRAFHGSVSLEVAVTAHSLGVLLWRSSRFAEAEPLLQEAVHTREVLLGAYHPKTLRAKTSLGALSFVLGDLDAAIAGYYEAVAGRRHHLDDRHPSVVRSRADLGLSLLTRGLEQNQPGDLDAALDQLETALRIQRQIDSPTQSDQKLGRILKRHMAAVLAAKGRPAAAEALLRQLLLKADSWSEADRWRHAEIRSLLGSVLVDQGRADEAEALFSGTIEAITQARGEDSVYARWAKARVDRWRKAMPHDTRPES